MKPVAVVDIGTNSVKLTVGSVADGTLNVLADTTRITRLGKNVDKTNRLEVDSVAQTMNALREFADLARAHGAEKIAAVGTSALRDAENGPLFVDEAQQILGGRVEVIAGEREAHLIYLAARRDPDLNLPQNAPVAVMDIGGGSTEFVLGQGDAVSFRDSLQLGAVRITERTLPSDPPGEAETAQAIVAVDAILEAVPVPQEAVILVGSGGTIANLAAMEQGSKDNLHGQTLSRAQIEARIADLASKSVAERRQIAGLEPERADVILAGAIIQARAMHRLNAESVRVSVRNLRYGLLYELSDNAAA